jgi:hypothetical protein
MNRTKKLAAQVAGAVAIVTLVGTSAFADTRHHDATEHDRSQHSDRGQSRDSNRGSHDRGSSQSRTNNNQTYERHDARAPAPQWSDRRETRGTERFQNNERFQSNDRFQNNQRLQSNDRSWSGNDRFQSNDRFRSGNDRFQSSSRFQSSGFRNDRPAFDDRGRRSMQFGGRINRFEHESGGFRVWVDGGRFPIFIPEARIGLFPRLRIGLALNFGGYYDPRGYLDAYDYYGYDGAYIGAPVYGSGYTSGLLRGIVESVDYRRGTLVIRDDASGAFVTTIIRDRRMEDLRPGDYAEISGDWTRAGVFEGLRLEDDRGRY